MVYLINNMMSRPFTHPIIVFAVIATFLGGFVFGQPSTVSPNISGRVINESGNPVDGAQVLLALDKHHTTTDANGDFIISKESPLKAKPIPAPHTESYLKNGIFHFTARAGRNLRFTIFNLNGDAIHSGSLPIKKSGSYNLVTSSLVSSRLPNALYVARISHGSGSFFTKIMNSGPSRPAPKTTLNQSSQILAKISATAEIADTLIVTKSGYSDSRVLLTGYDARLGNITLRTLVDRQAVVSRHNYLYTKAKPDAPLSLGNGQFAFTVDATGLQTFPDDYTYFTLSTMSDWGWHSNPNPKKYKVQDCYKYYDHGGRKVPYVFKSGPAGAIAWLRENPHRVHLGRVGMELTLSSGKAASLKDLKDIQQTLNVWTGELTSAFVFNNEKVTVNTHVHSDKDLIFTTIHSKLFSKDGGIKIALRFPYGSPSQDGADWGKSNAHKTTIVSQSETYALFSRTMDTTTYFMEARWKDGRLSKSKDHHYFITPSSTSETFSFSCWFHPTDDKDSNPTDYATSAAATAASWKQFWTQSAFIDLSNATDPRAPLLEKNIIRSRYLTRIQCTGFHPPQETGLTYNSWNGKPHLEMSWWHLVHWGLWNNLEYLEKTLDWYISIMPQAAWTAKEQGFKGIRWPKMVGPNGVESPSGVNALLIWQQTHPITFAEMCYRQHPDQATLEKYKEMVFQSAEFMASFAHLNSKSGKYHLGPTIIHAAEELPRTYNPVFELCQWWWGLNTAQKWRERLGLERDPSWDKVKDNLADLPQNGGVYTFQAEHADYYKSPKGHPTTLSAFGMLPPTPLLDTAVMAKTLDKTWSLWPTWAKAWGWDNGVIASCAARLGKTDIAIDALFDKKFKFLDNNHLIGRLVNNTLPGYLPGNGSLLFATGMMAGGWEGDDGSYAPGFPKNGKWNVRVEGFRQWE